MLAALKQRAFLLVNLPERRYAIRARLLRPWYQRRLARFGAGAILVSPRAIRGGHKIVIGDGCLVWPGCTLSVERSSWDVEGPLLTLGTGAVLQSNVTITCAERVTVDDYAAIGANTLISDNDHTIDGSAESILSSPIRTAPVRVGRGAWVGNNVAILRGSSIGDYCVIGANSVVRGDVPPYSIAVGAPARVVGRVPHPDAPAAAGA